MTTKTTESIRKGNLAKLLAQINSNVYLVNAAGYLIRAIAKGCPEYIEDNEIREETLTVVCNGLLVATSELMTGLDELEEILGVEPDWESLKGSAGSPSEAHMAIALQKSLAAMNGKGEAA